MSIRTLRRVIWPALLSATVLGLAACGDSDDSDSGDSATTSSGTSTTGTRNAEVADQVPAAIKSKGTLTVAADATYAPNEFIGADGKTVIGHGRRPRQGARRRHGPEGDASSTRPSTAIIPGLDGQQVRHRHVVVHRHEGARGDRRLRDVLLAPARRSSSRRRRPGRSRRSTTSAASKVAVEKGTTQADDATAQSKKCTARRQGDGRPCSCFPTRTARTWRSRAAARRSAWPTRRSPRTRSRSRAASSSSPASPTAPRRTASRSRRTASWPSRVLAAIKAADRGRQVQADPRRSGASQDGAIDDPVINGATS